MDHLGVSERRACKALGQSRATQRFLPLVREDEDRLTQRIIELAADCSTNGTCDTSEIGCNLGQEYAYDTENRLVRVWREPH